MYSVVQDGDRDAADRDDLREQEDFEEFLDDPGTSLLFETVDFVLGEQQPEFVGVKVNTNLERHKDTVFGAKIFNVPILYTERLIRNTRWQPAEYVDEDSKIPLRSEFKSSSIKVLPFVNFNENLYEYSYYQLYEIMFTLGGYRAFFSTLMTLVLPFLAVVYVMELAWVIQDNLDFQFRKQIYKFLELAKKKIPLLKRSSDTRKI